MPIIETIQTFDYKAILAEYKNKHSKELKSVKPHKNSKHVVPSSTKCPRCNAPH